MTAFAASARDTAWGRVSIELRSLNHRFLDLAMRLPEEFRSLEPQLRERLAERLSRGKVDLSLRWKRLPGFAGGELKLNRPLAEQLAGLAAQMRELFPDSARSATADWLRWPGVVEESDPDVGSIGKAAMVLVDQALDELLGMRAREGERLCQLIQERLDQLAPIVESVRQVLPDIRKKMGERLNEKVSLLVQQVDAQRLEQEIALLLQRMDVDEEIDRLAAHCEEVRRALAGDEPVGRRLDFLMQELHREANTLGSKSVDARTTQASVDLKVLIEQMREQVQNIE